MNAPDDYEELDYQPRITLHQSFVKTVGLESLWVMGKMYKNPYEPFIFYSDWLFRQDMVNTIVKLIGLGMVATVDGGFQLTADGRFHYHNYHTDFMARMERQAHHEREIDRMFPRDEYENWPDNNFDLLDFG